MSISRARVCCSITSSTRPCSAAAKGWANWRRYSATTGAQCPRSLSGASCQRAPANHVHRPSAPMTANSAIGQARVRAPRRQRVHDAVCPAVGLAGDDGHASTVASQNAYSSLAPAL